MTFLLVKHLHISAAILSIIFFVVRAWWSVTGSGWLQLRIVKVLPHIIDTVLLVCGIILTVMMGGLQTWIVTKIIALVFYIGVGTVAIKRGRTASSRAVAALIAIAIFFYIVGVALSHNPLSWFA